MGEGVAGKKTVLDKASTVANLIVYNEADRYLVYYTVGFGIYCLALMLYHRRYSTNDAEVVAKDASF